MIRVELHQAGEKKVAGEIVAPPRSPLVDRANAPIRHGDPTTPDHAVGENDTGILDEGRRRRRSCRDRPAMSMTRVLRRGVVDVCVVEDAEHGRAAAAFFAAIRSTTTARLPRRAKRSARREAGAAGR